MFTFIPFGFYELVPESVHYSIKILSATDGTQVFYRNNVHKKVLQVTV